MFHSNSNEQMRFAMVDETKSKSGHDPPTSLPEMSSQKNCMADHFKDITLKKSTLKLRK